MNDTTFLPGDVNYFQVGEVRLGPVGEHLKLTLMNPIDTAEQVTLVFRGLAFFRFAKDAEDEEGSFQIGSIALELRHDVVNLFHSVGYSGSDVVVDGSLYYLALEGDLNIDVISTDCVVMRNSH